MTDRTSEVNEIRQAAVEATSQSYTLADYDGDVELFIEDAKNSIESLELDGHDMELFEKFVREFLEEEKKENKKYDFSKTFKAQPDEWLSLSFEKFKAIIDQAANSKEMPKIELRSRFYSNWENWRTEMLLDEASRLPKGSEINIAIGDESHQDGVVIDADDVQIIVLGKDEFAYRLQKYTTDTSWKIGSAEDAIIFAANIAVTLFTEKLFSPMR